MSFKISNDTSYNNVNANRMNVNELHTTKVISNTLFINEIIYLPPTTQQIENNSNPGLNSFPDLPNIESGRKVTIEPIDNAIDNSLLLFRTAFPDTAAEFGLDSGSKTSFKNFFQKLKDFETLATAEGTAVAVADLFGLDYDNVSTDVQNLLDDTVTNQPLLLALESALGVSNPSASVSPSTIKILYNSYTTYLEGILDEQIDHLEDTLISEDGPPDSYFETSQQFTRINDHVEVSGTTNIVFGPIFIISAVIVFVLSSILMTGLTFSGLGPIGLAVPPLAFFLIFGGTDLVTFLEGLTNYFSDPFNEEFPLIPNPKIVNNLVDLPFPIDIVNTFKDTNNGNELLGQAELIGNGSIIRKKTGTIENIIPTDFFKFPILDFLGWGFTDVTLDVSFVKDAVDTSVGFLNTTINLLNTALDDLVSIINTGLSTVINDSVGYVNDLIVLVNVIIESIETIINNELDTIVDGINSIKDDLVNGINNTKDNIQTNVQTVFTTVQNSIRNLDNPINSSINSINSGFTSVQNIINDIINAINELPGISIPQLSLSNVPQVSFNTFPTLTLPTTPNIPAISDIVYNDINISQINVGDLTVPSVYNIPDPADISNVVSPVIPTNVTLPLEDTVGVPLQFVSKILQTISEVNTPNIAVRNPIPISLTVQLEPDSTKPLGFKDDKVGIQGLQTMVTTMMKAASSAINLDLFDLLMVFGNILLQLLSGQVYHFNYKYRTNKFD